MEHDWRKKHYSKPTWCAVCSKFIWGLGKQGFVCRVCTFPAHPKCLALVDTPCSGHKLSHTKKTLDQARETSTPAATTTTSSTRGAKERPAEPEEVTVPDVDVDDEDVVPKTKTRAPPRPFTTQSSVLRIDADKEELVEGAMSINDVYTIGEELGRGAFSTVHKAVNKATGELFAVKIINKKNVQQDLHRLAIEMNILKRVDHPNIIRLQDLFETEEFLYIVTEIVTGGELFDRIVTKGSYSERDAAVLTKKLIQALEYLHELNIAHRDLKPENLLLKSAEEDSEIKLADFGLSKIIGQEAAMQTACGTPGYVAPEVLLAKGYGKEVDMWSSGVICYILLCGFPPFYHEKIPLLFESIMKADYDYPPEYWDHISDDAINFIDHLLVVDPKKRMTATQALQHPWLTKNAPNTPLPSVGGKMNNYMKLHKEQSRASQPTSADES